MPRYVRYVATAGHGGNVNPGDEIGTRGACSFHDAAGLPIDPLAVACAFTALMAAHQPLQRRALSAPFAANHQVKTIAALATTAQVRVRLTDHAGRPHDGARLRGLTTVSTATGLFTRNPSSGSTSNLPGTVTKTAASTAFPEAQRRLLVLGPATSGRLGQSVRPPKLPPGVVLKRDFLALRVVEQRASSARSDSDTMRASWPGALSMRWMPISGAIAGSAFRSRCSTSSATTKVRT